MSLDPSRVSAVFDAVRAGDVPALRAALARRPALANARLEGATPLHVAAWENRPDVATVLLDAGAKLDAHDDRHGMLPIAWANERGHMAMVGFLRGRGAHVPFQLLAAFGLVEDLKTEIDADPGQIDEARGFGTALHFASVWGQAEAARILIDAGADTTLRNEDGELALTIARRQTEPEAAGTMLVIESRKSEIQSGCERVVSLLEAAGAPG